MKHIQISAIAVVSLTILAVLLPSQSAFSAPAKTRLQSTQRTAVLTDVAPGFLGSIDVSCLAGEIVTGGGFRWGEYILNDFSVLIGQSADVARSSQYSIDTWRVSVLNTGTQTIDIEANVMCSKII